MNKTNCRVFFRTILTLIHFCNICAAQYVHLNSNMFSLFTDKNGTRLP